MSHLMPSEKLEEQLPKLIPGILALYKKHAEAFYISKVRSWGARSCCPGPVPDPGCASPWSPATAPGQGQLLGGSHTVPRGRCPTLPTAVGWGSPLSPPLPALGLRVLARLVAPHLLPSSPCPTADCSPVSRCAEPLPDPGSFRQHRQPQPGRAAGRAAGHPAPPGRGSLGLGGGIGKPLERGCAGAELGDGVRGSPSPGPAPASPPSSSRRCWQPVRSGAGRAGVTWTAGVPLRVSSGCVVTRRGKTNLWGLADLSNSSLRVNKPGAGSTRGPLLRLPSLSPGS